MAMNREQKRAMQKAGELAPDGTPKRSTDRKQPTARVKEARTSPKQFFNEVVSEMRKVAWPTRSETLRLALIVFIAIVALGTFIFLIDLAFAQISDFLFTKPDATDSAGAVLLASPFLRREP